MSGEGLQQQDGARGRGGGDRVHEGKVEMTMMFSSFFIAFWRVMVSFRFPPEPLPPLWVVHGLAVPITLTVTASGRQVFGGRDSLGGGGGGGPSLPKHTK